MSALTFQPAPTAATRTPEGLRVMRLAVLAVGLHRAITVTGVLSGGVMSTPMATTYAAVAMWSVFLLWRAWQAGSFGRRLAVADAAFAATVGLWGLAFGAPGMKLGYGVLQGAAIVAGCALPLGALAIVMAALVSVKFAALWLPPHGGGITVAEFVAYAATLVALAIAAAIAHRLLRRAAGALDRRAGAADRLGDGAEQRRVLHDTALATLTAIASGKVDASAREVRARAARDATYLRLMVQGGRMDDGGLGAALAGAVADVAALGIKVHPLYHVPESDMDGDVVAAMAMATREALNNVHRHAGTGEAWLTAAAEGARIVIRVVDRGRGFVSATTPAGTGIRDSIVARMRRIGGVAMIESVPGEGTCVELRWPR